MTHEILVLGAGYAGLAAAGRAARNIRRDALDARVTLVNAAPDFVERVRLHQVAAGQDVGVHPLAASLDGTGIDLVLGRAEHVDTGRRTVRVRVEGQAGQGEPEREFGYDTLIYALGSDAGPDGASGAAEHAYNAASLEAARALARRIREDAPRSVAVVGGGLTGLEVAAEIAESHPGVGVELLTRGRVADGVSPRGRTHVHRALGRLGVSVREGASVAEVDPAGLRLADGSRVEADLVVWSTGLGAAALAAEAGLTVDRDGRAVVGADQRSVSHPDVYVVGDAAHAVGVHGAPQRMSCAMAMPMGWTAADAVTARVRGDEPELPPFGHLFQCVSLGRRDGLVQFVRGDASPVRFVLTGRLAALCKEYIVASAYSRLNGGQWQPDQHLVLVRWAARHWWKRHGSRRRAVEAAGAVRTTGVTGRNGRPGRASAAPDPR